MTNSKSRAADSRPTDPGPSPSLVPPVAGYFELVHQSVETNREAAAQWAAWMSWVTVAAREHAEGLSFLSTRRARRHTLCACPNVP